MTNETATATLRPERRYVGVLLRDHSGNLILQTRTEANQRIVTTFGGGVEIGEADVSAAIREIREELDICLSPSLLEPLVALPKFDDRGLINCQYYVYLAPVSIEGVVLTEGDGVLLMPLADLGRPRVAVTPVTRIALEQFERHLDGSLRPSVGSSTSPGFVQSYAQNRCLTVQDAVAWANVLKAQCVEQRSTQAHRVLDLGCGTGRFLPLLRHTLGSEVTVGADLSPAMASHAALLGYHAVCADAAKLPFASGAFDVIWSSLVWHQLSDSSAACREVFRLLAENGGQFLLRTGFTGDESTGELFEYFPSARAIQMRRYQTKEDLFRDLSAAGFGEIRHVPLDIPVAPSFSEYLQKVRSRAYSILWELPEEEYLQGLRRMESDQQRGRTGCVSLPCDVMTARKGGMP